MVKSPEHSLPPDTVWLKYVPDWTKEYQYKYGKNKKIQIYKLQPWPLTVTDGHCTLFTLRCLYVSLSNIDKGKKNYVKNLSDRSRGIEKIRLRQFFLKEIYYELVLKTWYNLTWITQWMKYGLVLGQGEREYVKEIGHLTNKLIRIY